jgi:hypothetical protein
MTDWGGRGAGGYLISDCKALTGEQRFHYGKIFNILKIQSVRKKKILIHMVVNDEAKTGNTVWHDGSLKS